MTISNYPETGNTLKDSCDFLYAQLRDGLTEARDVIMEGQQTPGDCRAIFNKWVERLATDFAARIHIEALEEFDERVAK